MIQVSFTEDEPAAQECCGVVLYDNEVIAPEYSAALACKSSLPVVELMSYDGRQVRRTLLVRLGDQEKCCRKSREERGEDLFIKAIEGTSRILCLDCRNIEEKGLDLVMGMLLKAWTFDRYRTSQRKDHSLKEIMVVCRHATRMKQAFERLKTTIEGVNYARALTSEPPNVHYPAAYAERLTELAELGVDVKILDENELESLGMHALLAVGKGSCHPPRVAVLTWQGSGGQTKPIALIGKGVCFDSGGLCLKATAHQADMKWDKAGAGVVAGVIKTLALQKSPAHVVGILGLVENMPDGKAVKPGDITMTMSGQTVEIINTDAEGRLVLADCMWYAQKNYNPDCVIDLGTLTIETFASLGNSYAGLYSNQPALAGELQNAGKLSGDLLWELPMGKFFAQQIESSVADMKNVGIDLCGENGAAAEFLQRFVINGTPWAHIDIAGVSWTFQDTPSAPKQVTGWGVRLLEEWINERSNAKT